MPSARTLAWQVLRRHRAHLAFGMLLMLVGRAAALLLPASTKYMFDDVIAEGRDELLLPIAAAVLGATIVIAATSYLLTLVLSVTAQRTVADMRLDLQRHVLRLPLHYHDEALSGSLGARVLLDPEAVTNLIGTGVIQLAGGVLTAALGVAVLLYLNWTLALVTVLLLATFAALFLVLLLRLRPLVRERSEQLATLAGRLNEMFAGIRAVRAHSVEPVEQERFAAGVGRLRGLSAQSLLRVAMLSSLTALTVGALGVFIMVAGGRAVIAGSMTPGELLWFATTVAFVARPLQTAANAAAQLTQAFAGLDRMLELKGAHAERYDDAARAHVTSIEGDILLDRVSFTWSAPGEASSAGVHEVSLHARPGTLTAIVGPSGAGKSTLLHLLLGLYQPQRGRVLIDGRDLQSLRLDEYRRYVGVVLQDAFLFDGTIRDNIAWARPDATDAEVEQAARTAQAAEFIARLPGGYHSIVGERGVRLSAGQRQRIALARAVLAQPRILVLDEVTAHLDPATQRKTDTELARFRTGRTTFVMAHDINNVPSADQVLVLEHGHVVQHIVGTEVRRPHAIATSG